MKEEINLLPIIDQEERMTRLYFYRFGQIIRRLDLVLMIVLLAMGVIYVGIISLDVVSQNKVLITPQKGVDYSEQIKSTNELLKITADRTLKYHSWTPTIESILHGLPPTLLLTSLSVDEANQVLQIQGITTDRVGITQLEKFLQTLPDLDTLTSPLSNFATGHNQVFTFKLTRKVPPV